MGKSILLIIIIQNRFKYYLLLSPARFNVILLSTFNNCIYTMVPINVILFYSKSFVSIQLQRKRRCAFWSASPIPSDSNNVFPAQTDSVSVNVVTLLDDIRMLHRSRSKEPTTHCRSCVALRNRFNYSILQNSKRIADC